MRITMLTAAATRTRCFTAGHTYDVGDADGAEFVRAGHARPPEGDEHPDVVITRKPGAARPVQRVAGPMAPPAAVVVTPVAAERVMPPAVVRTDPPVKADKTPSALKV